jgi:hypothetical protein
MKVSQNICKKIIVFALWGAFGVGNVTGSLAELDDNQDDNIVQSTAHWDILQTPEQWADIINRTEGLELTKSYDLGEHQKGQVGNIVDSKLVLYDYIQPTPDELPEYKNIVGNKENWGCTESYCLVKRPNDREFAACLKDSIWTGNADSFLSFMNKIERVTYILCGVLCLWDEQPKWWKNPALTPAQKLIKYIVRLTLSQDVKELKEIVTLFSNSKLHACLNGCYGELDLVTLEIINVFSESHLKKQQKLLNDVVEKIVKIRSLDPYIRESLSKIRYPAIFHVTPKKPICFLSAEQADELAESLGFISFAQED